MKKITLFLLLLGVLPMLAQEYYTKEVRIGQFEKFLTTRPVDVTEEVSEASLRYLPDFRDLFVDDLITQISFTGYNPGGEVKRHVTIEYGYPLGEVAFDGDVIIPSGGTADAPITLLSFELAQPIKARIYNDFLVKSSGDVADTPVYFEGYDYKPVMTVTKQVEVVYYEGTVSAMDGTPIAGADVCLYLRPEGQHVLDYHATTDDEGRYSVRVEESNSLFSMSVEALNYPVYIENKSFAVKDGVHVISFKHPPKDITLRNSLDFKAGQQATIFLPEAPDASWGRYYRFDRYEGRDLIFEREMEPLANVPYVIFPNRDFSLDVSGYDHATLAENDYVPYSNESDGNEWNFHGSYCSKDITVSFYLHLFDETPDCLYDNPPRVGAFRAYIYALSGSVVQYGNEARFVFVGEDTDGISEPTEAGCLSPYATHQVFDLQGRLLHDTPQKGLYVRNGKKFIVK